MKKVWAIAILGFLAASSCSSKDEEKESNVMLQEPKVEKMDSSAVAKPMDKKIATKDSITLKVDTTKTK